MTIGATVFPNGLPDLRMPVPNAIEVIEAVGKPSQYKLSYQFGIDNGNLSLLENAFLNPDSMLSVIIAGEPIPEILVNGPVVRQEISLLNQGEGSQVDVYGMDRSITLDRETKVVVRSPINDSTAVTEILTTHGIVPADVSLTNTMHTELKHSLVQRETDLRFIRRLARRNGFWFWLSDEVPGVTIGHFTSPPINQLPSADIRINLEGKNDVDQLSISWNTERPVSADLNQLDINTLNDIQGSSARSSLTGLASNTLGDIVDGTRNIHLAVPVDDAGDLTARGDAVLVDSGWFVKVQLTLRKSVFKHVLRAHSVVNLRGAGTRHSGKYIVSRVVHRMNEDDHVMVVTLIRNGWNT